MKKLLFLFSVYSQDFHNFQILIPLNLVQIFELCNYYIFLRAIELPIFFLNFKNIRIFLYFFLKINFLKTPPASSFYVPEFASAQVAQVALKLSSRILKFLERKKERYWIIRYLKVVRWILEQTADNSSLNQGLDRATKMHNALDVCV